jgi:DNA-binding FadR family transcriptional regulator
VPKAAELVARELRRRIIRGELKEGDNLPAESALIEEFGISRPTMREAFRILETERLISVSRGARGGARVHMPDVNVVARYAGLYLQARNTTLADVHEARMLIEPPAARLMALRRPQKLIKELRQLTDHSEEHIDDPETFSHNNAEFHLKVIEGSANETLSLIGHVMHLIWDAHLSNAVGLRYDVSLARIGIKSQRKLLRLVEQGDADGVYKHMQAYLEQSGKILLRHSGAKSIVEVLA